MMDLYLRAADQKTMDDALDAAGLLRTVTNMDKTTAVAPSAGVYLDRIGQDPTKVTGYDATAKTAMGGPVPITVVVAGYHVNLRMIADPSKDQLAALAAVTIVPPNTPMRMWA